MRGIVGSGGSDDEKSVQEKMSNAKEGKKDTQKKTDRNLEITTTQRIRQTTVVETYEIWNPQTQMSRQNTQE